MEGIPGSSKPRSNDYLNGDGEADEGGRTMDCVYERCAGRVVISMDSDTDPGDCVDVFTDGKGISQESLTCGSTRKPPDRVVRPMTVAAQESVFSLAERLSNCQGSPVYQNDD